MKKRTFIAGVITGVVLSGVTVAVASIPDSGTQVISGCYSTKNGALRVINYQVGRRCVTGEVLLQWNQRGLQGATGLTGPTGPQGLKGETGPQGTGLITTIPRVTVPFVNGQRVVHLLAQIDSLTSISMECQGMLHGETYIGINSPNDGTVVVGQISQIPDAGGLTTQYTISFDSNGATDWTPGYWGNYWITLDFFGPTSAKSVRLLIQSGGWGCSAGGFVQVS